MLVAVAVASRHVHDSRAQLEQLEEVTGEQGQCHNRLVGDGSAQGGGGGIDRRGFLGDRDGLGLLAGRQRKIDANVLATSSSTLVRSTVWNPLASARTV